MSCYNFGKPITYELHINDADHNEIDITGATFVSAFLFDERVTREVGQVGTGSIASILTWDSPEGGIHKELSLPEIDDPEPFAEFKRHSYWISVNFRFAEDAQVQTVLKELPIERVRSQSSSTGVSYADIEKAFPNLERYFSNVNEIANMIEVAEEVVKIYLSAAGFNWAQIESPKALHTAVKFKTLADICLVQSVDPNDAWQNKYTEYAKTYQNIISSTKLQYDASNDGKVDVVEMKPRFVRIIR